MMSDAFRVMLVIIGAMQERRTRYAEAYYNRLLTQCVRMMEDSQNMRWIAERLEDDLA